MKIAPANDDKEIVENPLIYKFGYESIIKIDDTSRFMFEIFIPVELLKSPHYSQKNVTDVFNIK